MTTQKQNITTVFIVEDHPILRSGLEHMLQFEDDIEMIGYCDDGDKAFSQIQALKPDVIIMDVNLPGTNGLRISLALKNAGMTCGIIIFTAHHDEEQIIHAFKSGASAYCPKDIPAETLVAYIKDVAQGYFIVNDKRYRLSGMLAQIEAMIEANPNVDAENSYMPLTTREMEILEHVTEGMINKEIAQKLGISQQTVKNHMTAILRKLNVNDRTQAAVVALRRGWVRINKGSQQEA